jgi:AcrR family transcriptional regulator
MKAQSRPYRQTSRAESSAQTEQAIMKAAMDLFAASWFDEVTLDAVASAAGVTVKTVMRRFGSKENLARVCFLDFATANSAWRDQVPAGDLSAAIAAIVEMYEEVGDGLVRYLSLEERIPFLAEMLPMGRALHLKWLQRVFGPLMPADPDPQALDLLVIATDVLTWKLLRRDRNLSVSQTARAMRWLSRAALQPKGNPP